MKGYTATLPNGEATVYIDRKRWLWLLSVAYPLEPLIGTNYDTIFDDAIQRIAAGEDVAVAKSALQEAHDKLEDRVQERTLQLTEEIEERRKIRLFYWQSAFGDFFSCLVYLPRDGYSGRARMRLEALLQRAFAGTLVDSQLAISESTLARLTLTIQRTNPKAKLPDAEALQAQVLEVATSWVDRAREALLGAFPEDKALALHARFAACFPVAYQESAPADRMSRDFAGVESVLAGDKTSRFKLVGKRYKSQLFARSRPIMFQISSSSSWRSVGRDFRNR